MELNKDNYHLANTATRDILFMYIDMIESYSGFGHNLDTGQFNPFDYIDITIKESKGYSLGLNIKLLHAGSSIALLCSLSDAWDEYETWDVKIWPIISKLKKAHEENRFSHLPDIEKAVKLGFGDCEVNFREQLKAVYKNHVVNYFSTLLEDSLPKIQIKNNE